jgi:hypothetical protein
MIELFHTFAIFELSSYLKDSMSRNASRKRRAGH